MKVLRTAALVACVYVVASASAETQSLGTGIAGVPWSGSREEFRRAIPGLSCAPAACRGRWGFHGIPGEIELVWGGLSTVITSSTFKFHRAAVAEMKKILTKELGRPRSQYKEDGELVTEWKISGSLIDLYHGSMRDLPQIYIEPKRHK